MSDEDDFFGEELEGDAADEFLKSLAGGDDEPDDDDGDEFDEGFGIETFGEGPDDAEPADADSNVSDSIVSKPVDSDPAPVAAMKDDPETVDPFDAYGSEPLGAVGTGGQLAWRETYFILFDHDARPTLTQVEATIGEAGRRLVIENLQADEDGLFRSVLVQAPEDNAALEISFESGDAVIEQSAELAKALHGSLEGDHLARLLRADARLDIMHFERIDAVDPFGADPDDDLGDEAFMAVGLDPASLITVVEALATLTDGLPIDPAAGEVLL